MIPSLKILRLTDCLLASANQSLPFLNLTGLEELSLSWNYLHNPVASCWLWNLTRLQNLDLEQNDFFGQIPDALGLMTSLQVLNLPSTFTRTGIMKVNMTNLCNLKILDISYNYMNGNIMELLPHCFPNKLKELHLQLNNFTGVLPDWIGHRWSTLLILELYYNQFSGPVPSEIGGLTNLQDLDLSLNQFNGSVPSEIGRLNDLLRFDLSLNRFNGPVPSEILMLSKLTYIDLSNNNLTGVINLEHLAGLINLTKIDLSSNYLKIVVDPEWSPLFMLEYANFASCEMGPPFPVWLKAQANIVELNLSSVSISDRIPDWFFTTYSNAYTVDISHNAISGTLPKDLVNMTFLEKLYLNSNQLTGPVPQLPTNLSEFDISENSFSGTLSSDFGTQNLEYLNLASNRLRGPTPHSICQMEYLRLLNLANNYFDGGFPLCTEPGRPIKILILRNNKLSGNFPSSLKIWTDLYIMDLAWNKFSGRLPMWIGDFLELEILQLSHNMFTGSIPSSITRLKQLSQLNLAGNRLSGLLPPYLSNLTGMTRAYTPTFSAFTYSIPYGVIRAFRYVPFPVATHMNLSVITKGQERYYQDSELHGMVSIDLSSNQLFGGIPEEITSLDGVINMNLSWNQFSGTIPGKIGVMQSLESLDLKENNLDGEIPQSLSNISYLSYLDLSYNNLTGRIPSGGQLDTLYVQYRFMYNGNSGLCGLPLKKNCSNNS
jgi:Leucine-rich repeat (LRR) protein